MSKINQINANETDRDRLDKLVQELNSKLEVISESKVIDGKEYKDVSPDDKALFPDEMFDLAESYVKTAEVKARQATERETLKVSQDGTQYDAEPGDWIIKNPSDESEYLMGDPSSTTVEQRQAKFEKTYKPAKNKEGVFVSSRPPFKAVKINTPIVFEKWGTIEKIDKGGVMTRQADGERYGINNPGFDKDYGVYVPEDKE